MTKVSLVPDHLVSLTLAADARLNSIDLTNDQIWVFKLNHTEEPHISLETTYGLRARLCRIFPSFQYEGKVVNNPIEFLQPVIIHRYFPNFVDVSFKPFAHINVRMEFWVPDSHSLAARIKIHNTSNSDMNIQMDWSDVLLPSPEGSRMAINVTGLSNYLSGKTADLIPVLFLTGGAQPGKSPFPSLSLFLTIPPKGEKSTQWAHVALSTMEDSFSRAKAICAKNWDAEFASINLINSDSFEIHTGNKDWDAAFTLSQVIANQLFLQNGDSQKQIFVKSRRSEQGYSTVNEGKDYAQSWDGLTSLESYHLVCNVLHNDREKISQILDTFLQTQNSEGEIDFKLGSIGLYGHLLAAPIFANLLERLHEIYPDDEFLKAVFPKLLSNFYSWFTPKHDHDADGIPEWDQPVQTCFDERKLFSQNNPNQINLDIAKVECIDLVSYLSKECKSLIKLASVIDEKQLMDRLESISLSLQTMIDESWSDQAACFQYRDRDSHGTYPEEVIGTRRGAGAIDLHREFDPPIRPIIRLDTTSIQSAESQIYIYGTGPSGIHRIENIQAIKIHWLNQVGLVTSDYCYSTIERIEVTGINPEDALKVLSADLSTLDLSLTTPIWAGIPSKERAKILISLSLMNKKKFLSPHGLRTNFKNADVSVTQADYQGINMIGNAMILEGFIHYGERRKAAEVFKRIMQTTIRSMKTDMTFHHSYHAEDGKPIGAQNTINSLVPVSLFLNILGVKIFNPNKIEIDGVNPFPWPVTIKYQGLTIIKHETKSLVIFPDGHTINIHNDQKQVITRE